MASGVSMLHNSMQKLTTTLTVAHAQTDDLTRKTCADMAHLDLIWAMTPVKCHLHLSDHHTLGHRANAWESATLW